MTDWIPVFTEAPHAHPRAAAGRAHRGWQHGLRSPRGQLHSQRRSQALLTPLAQQPPLQAPCRRLRSVTAFYGGRFRQPFAKSVSE